MCLQYIFALYFFCLVRAPGLSSFLEIINLFPSIELFLQIMFSRIVGVSARRAAVRLAPLIVAEFAAAAPIKPARTR